MMANTINGFIKSEPLDDWSGEQDQQTNSEKHAFVINTGEPLIEVKKEETQDDETAERQDFPSTDLSQSYMGNVEELTIADVFCVSERAFNQEEGDFLIQVKSEDSQDARLNDPELSEICGLDSQPSEQVLDSPPKFACRFCSKCYYSYKHLVGHEKMHRNKKMFSCEHCGKGFVNASKCKQHKQTHSCLNRGTVHLDGNDCVQKDTEASSGFFQCDLCEKTYRHEKRLREHVRHVHSMPVNERPFKCSVYDKPPIASMKEEKRDSNGRLFQCHLCEKKYRQKSSLKEHERIHTLSVEALNARPYKCRLCENTYKRKSHLRAHERQHAAPVSDLNERPFQCQLCEKNYKRKSHLTEHEKVHASPIASVKEGKGDASSERPFQCQLCEKNYKRKSHLTAHEKLHTLSAEASDARPYKCQLCEKTYKRKSHLTEHTKMHFQVDLGAADHLRPFQCQLCEKNYKMKKHLRWHERTAHTQDKNTPRERKFKCNQCAKAYTAEKYLKDHKKTVHSLVRPFQCRYCEKTFVSFYRRKRHEYIHSTETPHACQFCSKAFRTKDTCRRHERIHFPKLPAKTSPKKHFCHKCGKSLSSATNLKYHLKAHLGLKEHMCQYCGKCFVGQPYLVKHERRYCPVKAKKHKCTMCKKDFSFQSQLHHHMFQVHSTEKEFEANLKASVSSNDQAGVLKIEQKKNHPTGQQSSKKKPHRCRVCEKSFQFLNLLKKHQFLHAALPKYKCDTCGRRYKTKAELARHCTHGHKEVIYLPQKSGVDVEEQSFRNNVEPGMCSPRLNFKLALPSDSEWGDNS